MKPRATWRWWGRCGWGVGAGVWCSSEGTKAAGAPPAKQRKPWATCGVGGSFLIRFGLRGGLGVGCCSSVVGVWCGLPPGGWWWLEFLVGFCCWARHLWGWLELRVGSRLSLLSGFELYCWRLAVGVLWSVGHCGWGGTEAAGCTRKFFVVLAACWAGWAACWVLLLLGRSHHTPVVKKARVCCTGCVLWLFCCRGAHLVVHQRGEPLYYYSTALLYYYTTIALRSASARRWRGEHAA